MAGLEEDIAVLEQKIRDSINAPRKRSHLVQDDATWLLLCSCLDTIGDTELAIDAYRDSHPSAQGGDAYLLVYGALQVLFVQQDAVENLCQALRLPYTRDPILECIRDIRNNSVGHPSKRGKGMGTAYNFLERMSLTKTGFRLMTAYPAKPSPSFEEVHIPDLIEKQRLCLSRTLSKVLKILKEEETEHRAQYRDDKLQVVFSRTLGYYLQKIGQAIRKTHPRSVGTSHLDLVTAEIQTFHGKLKERGIEDAYEPVAYEIDSLVYAISRLKSYFEEDSAAGLDAKDAEIFLFFIGKKLDEVKSMAVEIDQDYEAEP